MTRMKKYVAAAAVAAALAGVPTMAHALAPGHTTHTAAAKAESAPAPQVVAPGVRVHAGPGVQLWLTKEGKHWSTPEQADQFRSVVDGNLNRPGLSMQSDSAAGRFTLSGVYTGKGDAATVKVVTAKGTIHGTVVHLAGRPGWGAWYANGGLPRGTQAVMGSGFVRSITVSDTAGRTVASLTFP
jgi:hypothetical protein